MNDIEAVDLSKKFGRMWALSHCDLTIPMGKVAALVGPNGAGKTTLLHLAVGLAEPSSGSIVVRGGLKPGSDAALDQIAFVAQDAPLYQDLSVEDNLRIGRSLNRVWDQDRAARRLDDLSIPSRKKVGRLSGGQQSQLALAMALARRPALLVLDEPLARLDPLARHDFLALLMGAVSEDGIGVIFSSHVIPELQRIADYLVVLANGTVQVAGEVDTLLASHHHLTGPTSEVGLVTPSGTVIHSTQSARMTQILARDSAGAAIDAPLGWERSAVSMEELVLAYLRAPMVHDRSEVGAGR